MSEEILINVTPVETRVAVVENGMLQEVHIERSMRRGIVGQGAMGEKIHLFNRCKRPARGAHRSAR